MNSSFTDSFRIEPMGIRADQLAGFFGSEAIASEILKKGYLKPIKRGNRLTIYDRTEAVKAWAWWARDQRLKKQ